MDSPEVCLPTICSPSRSQDQISLLLSTIEHLSNHLDYDVKLKEIQSQRAVMQEEQLRFETGRVAAGCEKVTLTFLTGFNTSSNK